jgi:ribosomal protein S18 acetylase RimI-like enzyme
VIWGTAESPGYDRRVPEALADSVRLAWPSEAAGIAAVQRRAWAAQLPPDVAQGMLGSVSAEEMTRAWHSAITRPPQASYRVLVGVEAGRVVAFASIMPSPDEDGEPGEDGQIEEFVVDPPAQRRGHGSRLLHACADTLRSDGFSRARCWVWVEDEPLQAFLVAAGWAPDGAQREIGTEDEALRVRQVRLHTDLTT